MNILHINSYYTGRKLHENLYNHLKIYDIKQIVYVPASTSDNNNFIADDKNIIFSKCFQKHERFLYFRKHKKIFNNIRKSVKIEEIDVIHAHSLFSNGYIAYKIWKKNHIPYAVTVRNADINVFFGKIKFLNFLGKRILKNAKQIIFLSKGSENYFTKKYFARKDLYYIKEKIVIIPNGIDDFWLNNLNINKKATSEISEPIKLGIVGDILKNKNILRTIKVSEKLSQNGHRNQVYIVGKQMDNALLKKIKKTNAIYLGELSKEELMNFYRKIDILVLPSHHESFGLVYAEAISQGVPVIYTKNQGFDLQFCDGAVGYSVNSKSINDIYNKIKIIIANYDEITTDIAYNSLRFSWNDNAQNHYNIYNKIKEECIR